jgi:hypothetical protein
MVNKTLTEPILMAKSGGPKPLPTLANIMMALRMDPIMRDAFAFDEMLSAVVLMRTISTFAAP